MRISDWSSDVCPSDLMVNICTGFTAGGSSLTADGEVDHSDQSATEVGPLVHPDDPDGWHDLPVQQGRPQARRARRIDVWRAEGVLKVDAGRSEEHTSELQSLMRISYAVFCLKKKKKKNSKQHITPIQLDHDNKYLVYKTTTCQSTST